MPLTTQQTAALDYLRTNGPTTVEELKVAKINRRVVGALVEAGLAEYAHRDEGDKFGRLVTFYFAR